MIQVVWFKKDLRVSDHQPLWEACKRGPVLPLYVFEPEIMLAGDYSMQHYGFTRESLLSLEKQLRDIGLRIAIRHAPILQVIASLMSEFKGFSLLSHEETGNALSFQRDLAVGSWCRSNGIVWEEFASNSVVRRLKSRDRWASLWNQRMSMIPLNIPKEIQTISLTPNVQEWPDQLASVTFLQLSRQAEDKGHRQVGGLAVARGYLNSFLKGRGAHYRSAMSAPMTAQEACSRLSPYLTMGVLSVRQVVHELKAAQDYWRGLGPDHTPRGLLSSLSSFESRLHWHCHFIQKLESEPRLEFENLHPAYDGMRDSGTNGVRLKAWSKGETGYPMVDACMRMLLSTGWINFRMRAMLTSFSSYQLWQHWREPSLHLARQFLDYEPGIHYPQIQMQSGTTGINTIRIYNPVKQALDHDPRGIFVRRWLPELGQVPDDFIFEPWKMPLTIQRTAGCVIGTHYPHPLVDLVDASRFARDSVWGVRRDPKFLVQAQGIYEKHGSRRAKPHPVSPQQELF